VHEKKEFGKKGKKNTHTHKHTNETSRYENLAIFYCNNKRTQTTTTTTPPVVTLLFT
jgi:hypothetical protein